MAWDSTESLSPANDKQWAKKYLLDPLTDPEPSQETGPGSSFLNPLHRSASLTQKRPSPRSSTPHNTNYHTPPPSASPKTSGFSLSNLFRRASLRQKKRSRSADSTKVANPATAGTPNTARRPGDGRRQPPPPVTSPTTATSKYPPSAGHNRWQGANYNTCSKHPAGPSIRDEFDQLGDIQRLPSHWNSNNPFIGHRHTHSGPGPARNLEDRVAGLSNASGLRKSNSTNTRPRQPPPAAHLNNDMATTSAMTNTNTTTSSKVPSGNTSGIRRNRSLSERYAGDMSHRPLDMIRRDVRAADRAPHSGSRRHRDQQHQQHQRNKKPRDTDQIDVLDDATPGGPYHHGGPYDATLASRNVNPLYSPLAAVHASNLEALKATPREFVEDSLVKHVPLQGTASVPPGERAFGGKVMQYEEGADLMREPDAAGGPYRRWEGLTYHPDDLKGKGEPSYTFEKLEKEKKRRLGKEAAAKKQDGDLIEMESGVNASSMSRRKDGGVMIRQRSVSSAAAEPRTSFLNVPGGSSAAMASSSRGDDEDEAGGGGGLRRRNTTGKKFMKRFGSIRRRNKPVHGDDDDDADDYL